MRLDTLVRRRQIWWPTIPGWILLGLLGLAPALLWVWRGERFLTLEDRRPAQILVIEGWIGLDGVRAAKAEFDHGSYTHIVTVGASTNNRWGRRRWNYAELARDELQRLGVAPDRILCAPSPDLERQRTFESALVALRSIETNCPGTDAVNVFTLGVHARRSRLVFQKAFPSGITVGAVPWTPASYAGHEWWSSSERADEFIKETIGYFFEAWLNSGRLRNDQR